jgi:hypothetical protein
VPLALTDNPVFGLMIKFYPLKVLDDLESTFTINSHSLEGNCSKVSNFSLSVQNKGSDVNENREDETWEVWQGRGSIK